MEEMEGAEELFIEDCTEVVGAFWGVGAVDGFLVMLALVAAGG